MILTLAELDTWISQLDTRFREDPQHILTDSERLLRRTVKVSEECGEFSDAVLGYLQDQRGEKSHGTDYRLRIEEELADIIIAAAIAGKSANIDISHALQKKVRTLNARWGLN